MFTLNSCVREPSTDSSREPDIIGLEYEDTRERVGPTGTAERYADTTYPTHPSLTWDLQEYFKDRGHLVMGDDEDAVRDRALPPCRFLPRKKKPTN